MEKHYILCWRARRFWLVGPFPAAFGPDGAVTWARLDKNNPGDNPCWQHIVLSDEFVASPISVLTPNEATARAVQDAPHES